MTERDNHQSDCSIPNSSFETYNFLSQEFINSPTIRAGILADLWKTNKTNIGLFIRSVSKYISEESKEEANMIFACAYNISELPHDEITRIIDAYPVFFGSWQENEPDERTTRRELGYQTYTQHVIEHSERK